MPSLYQRVQANAIAALNPAQRATWDMIVAAYGKPEIEAVDDGSGAYAFTCEMEAGVVNTGYLELDGQVNWLG